MAQALLNREAAARGLSIRAESAGYSPAPTLDPGMVAVMAEDGIDLSDVAPRRFTRQLALSAQRIIWLSDDGSVSPLPIEQWSIPPGDASLEAIRQQRDAIQERVRTLVARLSDITPVT